MDIEIARENQHYRERQLQNALNDLELDIERLERDEP
jgi:hypothetical protein